jgi:hypothetical protein
LIGNKQPTDKTPHRIVMAHRRKRSAIPYDELYLWFARELGRRETSFIDIELEWTTVVDTGCGIYLHRPPLHNGGYSCTPTNTVKFANTGGEGVHFSFLLADGEWGPTSPVVMTCPAAGGIENVIVGESLAEFLGLGLQTGYFALEYLAHSAAAFDSGHPFVTEHLEPKRLASWLEPEEAEILRRLGKRFGLLPWTVAGNRLAELQRHLLTLTFGDRHHAILSGSEQTGTHATPSSREQTKENGAG